MTGAGATAGYAAASPSHAQHAQHAQLAHHAQHAQMMAQHSQSPPQTATPMQHYSVGMDSCWPGVHVKQEPADDPRDDVNDSGISPGRSCDSASTASGGGSGGAASGTDSAGPSPERGGDGGWPCSSPASPLPGATAAAPPAPASEAAPASDAAPDASPVRVQLQLQAAATAERDHATSPLRHLQMALERTPVSAVAGSPASAYGIKTDTNGWGEQPQMLAYSQSQPTHGVDTALCSSSSMNGAVSGLQAQHVQQQAAQQQVQQQQQQMPRSPSSEESMSKEDAELCGLEEDPGVYEPKINAQGKIKTFRCKQCPFVAVTKRDFWAHAAVHIKPDKRLHCTQCPFVTEYKHHLEYHLRNHSGSKPFKCPMCPYTCVNKSMLNSHLKSHSTIYQYRCADCSYATKYMHSLKLHLRKYAHHPDLVLNPDGTPNPFPVIDVYGTRRGPKPKSSKKMESNNNTLEMAPQQQQQQQQQRPQQYPNGAAVFANASPFLLRPPASLPYAFNPFLAGFPSFAALAAAATEEPKEMFEKAVTQPHPLEPEVDIQVAGEEPQPVPEPVNGSEPVDLSRAPEPTPKAEPAPGKNRRKGKAFKLDRLAVKMNLTSDEEMEEEGPGPSSPPVGGVASEGEASRSSQLRESPPQRAPAAAPPSKETFHCSYCGLTFLDVVMYTMHMGYHGFQDPFTCNMCGQVTSDRVSFFLHIARSPHL